MNRDELAKLAQQVWSAGGVYIGPSLNSLEQFAALVAADEREAVCKIVTGLCIFDNNAEEINRTIRARSKK